MEHADLYVELEEDQLLEHQLEKIRWTLGHAMNSWQYKKKLEDAKVKPEDIRTLEDFRRLPFTTADDLREGYPFPLLSIPEDDIVRVHASSGTTGKRKVLAYSKRDLEVFKMQMARCFDLAGLTSKDRLQIGVGYGLWTAGAGFQLGSEHLGMLTVPVGPGNLDMHLTLLEDTQCTCFASTASMALLLAEEVERHNLRDKLALRKVICGAETRSEKMRIAIEEKLGLEGSYDIAGMTEMYGPGTAIECEAHMGLHYWADLFYIEVLDTQTLQPVAEGEIGEMVVTSLCKEASPLIRYRTRDLSRMISGACACGRKIPRHDKILGRSDDMIIYRGVNIYPGQIMEVISNFSELAGEYHIQLSRDDHALDSMLIQVERREGEGSGNDVNVSTVMAKKLHKSLMARVEIEVVNYGALPRTFGKSKRVTDLRQ